MNSNFALRCAIRMSWGVALSTAVVSSQAQSPNRSVRAVPQRQSPVLAPGVVGPGAPNPAGLPSPLANPAGLTSPLANPAGLPSPMPNPAGLTSQFPAGLPSPSANPSGLPAPVDTVLPAPATASGRREASVDPVPQTNAMGASGYGVAAGPQSPSMGAAPYTALQIAQSFLGADANRDGELTRAEAQRLSIMPATFEEMDRNHDGILTRFEYEDAVR